MSRPIEQALLSLLPSHNSNLPPPLVEHAGSLLAQSRNKASTLKAEEEVARTYACAHIACDRLKIVLNLPPIEPRPPVPPRIYKRLYTHLDKILPATSLAGRPKANGLGTPRSKGISSPVSRFTPSRGTPTKEVSLSQFRTPSKRGTGTPSKVNTPSAPSSSLPPWILPTVRRLCTAFAADDGPDLARTVMAGLETIAAPYNKRTQDEWVSGHLTSLVGAIFWCVSESAGLAPGEELTPEASRTRYKNMRKDMLSVLRSAREEIQVTVPPRRKGRHVDATGDLEGIFWDGWEEDMRPADLDAAITEVTNRGWLNSDWYRSIEFIRDTADGAEGEQGGEDGPGRSPVLAAATVQITKADTMLQDKFDYLSERRRADYHQWKANIMRRIELLERGKDADPMEVDS
ncbi:hypothetical protein M406DRAFT_339640 [Cryphonectria parasitica EP155]|uniref:ORC6 first cyclin-like domain-containing protein n=1 Tax=Cryphonectria parasitica (strain ATCC 38755 / EP155) TaxID=660469 RepID=A0A9P5CQG4_CRYP1|nr:uncharacterized protein M406DRAFT_339640 [Cryphonectria parasitica EP155]KAF3766412.1 hypothetical protein M406DRAFT_339640 [Cryphonectria parasitica EP155]